MRKLITLLSVVTIWICSDTAKAQQQTVGTFINSSNALEGYTTVFPFNSNSIYLIDNCGLKVHEWTTSTPTLIAYLQSNGDIIKAGLDPDGVFGNPGWHGVLQRYNWQGDLLWEYKISNDTVILHHDIEVMPNGNILAIAWKVIGPEQLKAMGRDSMHHSIQNDLWEEVIYEIKPIGTNQAQIVWEWHVKDHIVQDYDPSKPNYGQISDHPELININYGINGSGNTSDWLHFNSLDYNSTLDQILISGLTFNEIYIIDHSATHPSGHIGGTQGKGGDIIYRWGNPQAYDKGGPQDKVSFGQHDPNWIKYGAHKDKIIFFNNGAGRGYSSVEIINPPMKSLKYELDPSGVFGPSIPDFIYTKSPQNQFYSQVMSGTEILPNGNVFMVEATRGKYTEYNIQTNTIVWEYINPVKAGSITKQGESAAGNNTFRAYKYPVNYGAFAGRTLTPGLPLEIDPWPSDCNGIDTTTQDTTQDTTASIYYTLLDREFSHFVAYPNPNKGQLNLRTDLNAENIRVCDVNGRELIQSDDMAPYEQQHIDLSNLDNGLYFLNYSIRGQQHSKRIILTR